MKIQKVAISLSLSLLIFNSKSITTQAQLTPEHVAKIKSVISAVIAPDANHVAYTLATPADPEQENVPSKVHLYVLNTKTNVPIPYYTSTSVSEVKFRPKKGTITFITKASNDQQNAIYEININGGEARKIFTTKSNILSYDWHFDGNQIVYTTIEKAQRPKTTLTYSPSFFEEEFGKRNAYITNIANPTNNPNKLEITGEVYQAIWSKDGNKIAISVAPTSSVDDSYMKQQVKIVDPYSNKIIATVNNQGKLSQIEWSPDSRQLALVAARDLNDPTDGNLHIVSVDGGNTQLIDAQFQGKYEAIDWQHSSKINFLASVGTSSALGEINIKDQKKKYSLLTPELHITSFTSASNNTYFVANSSNHPGEVFRLGSPQSPFQKVTDSNPWLNTIAKSKQEVVKYKTRDAKYEIEGMLIYPLNYSPGTEYPLITVVHGGPESHYSNGWLTNYSMPGHMAAARGYAVFYPNYRGSTGRGNEFTYSSQSAAAGAEFDDIVDGVDYLISKGIADPNRIGVTGGSYGGYASAWMSTYYSHKFAAAVMFVGISNNVSKFGTSDIPNEMYHVHARKYPWEEWQAEFQRSPIYHVDKANTPILIMHGADDPRVHPTQSMELYRHLKVRKPNVPVRLIYYPGEGHGNIRSGSRYDYNLRMLQWFDIYLKTGNRQAPLPSLNLPTPTK